LTWFNEENELDLVLKSAIAHLWFVVIHPFSDGNGRITRALSDLLLARADDTLYRFYSLSSQILVERKQYYDVLQRVQHNDGDITPWLEWYLNCLLRAIESTENTVGNVFQKAEFWDKHKDSGLNLRQQLMLNKLLEDFKGNLTSAKWAKITKSSHDTALRDIQDLVGKGILRKAAQGGRSTNYEMIL
jgi:Fic family protein